MGSCRASRLSGTAGLSFVMCWLLISTAETESSSGLVLLVICSTSMIIHVIIQSWSVQTSCLFSDAMLLALQLKLSAAQITGKSISYQNHKYRFIVHSLNHITSQDEIAGSVILKLLFALLSSLGINDPTLAWCCNEDIKLGLFLIPFLLELEWCLTIYCGFIFTYKNQCFAVDLNYMFLMCIVFWPANLSQSASYGCTHFGTLFSNSSAFDPQQLRPAASGVMMVVWKLVCRWDNQDSRYIGQENACSQLLRTGTCWYTAIHDGERDQ